MYKTCVSDLFFVFFEEGSSTERYSGPRVDCRGLYDHKKVKKKKKREREQRYKIVANSSSNQDNETDYRCAAVRIEIG